MMKLKKKSLINVGLSFNMLELRKKYQENHKSSQVNALKSQQEVYEVRHTCQLIQPLCIFNGTRFK